MTNVIHLNAPVQRLEPKLRNANLVAGFARHRRFGDDVFWLKENAELLNILECTGLPLAGDALAPHQGFYDQIEKRLGFFPQYYRFLLSICLDLEDLGMTGTKGEALCQWIAHEGLAQAELSDLQRAEARRLLARRGVDSGSDDGLTERLHAFVNRSETFALPNKKAAYELTHILFYLSEYGRRDPQVSEQAITSLEYAGLLAYLDQNADLLAEVCVALRYAGATPSPIWEGWIEREVARFAVQTEDHADPQDDYHDYFVCNWLLALSGREAFKHTAGDVRMSFHRATHWPGPLRDISECLFQLEDNRSDDWQMMRLRVERSLSEIGHDILAEAEESTDKFDSFFNAFARTGLRGVAL